MSKKNPVFALTFLILLLLAVGPATGQEKDCAASEPSDTCKLKEVLEAARQEVLNDKAEVVAADNITKGGEETRDLNMANSAPDSFAGDLHASVQNFLNLFDFAISDVEESEDGQALILRMNPLRRGRNQLGLTLTVSKPTVGGRVENAIPEDVRTATVERLEKLQGDVDDLTFSLSYTRSTKQCQLEKIKDGRCWGRRVETYRPLLAHSLEAAAMKRLGNTEVDPFEMQVDLVSQLNDAGIQLEPTANLLDLELSALVEEKRTKVVDQARKLGKQYGEETDASKMYFKEAGLGNLASLIDNQPQLAATVSYRDPAEFGGPEEGSFDLELQWGRKNLNWLFNQPDYVDALAKIDEDELAKDKFVLTVSYKWREDFQLGELLLPGEDGTITPVDGFEAIDDDTLEEFRAKLQWGQPVGMEVAGRQSRFDLSVDGIWTSDDEKRNENRWVATATLTVPLGDQMSLPISLKYADKPEFLTDTREELGVHFGLSYRLPWELE